jgi:hypothetical protein
VSSFILHFSLFFVTLAKAGYGLTNVSFQLTVPFSNFILWQYHAWVLLFSDGGIKQRAYADFFLPKWFIHRLLILGRVEEYSQEVDGTSYGDVIHYFLDTMLSLFACCRDYYNVVAWACADRVLHSHQPPAIVAPLRSSSSKSELSFVGVCGRLLACSQVGQWWCPMWSCFITTLVHLYRFLAGFPLINWFNSLLLNQWKWQVWNNVVAVA